MPSINEIFSEVIQKIVPTQKELDIINSIVKELKQILSKKAKELGIKFTEMEPQGSTGVKQTQLKNDFDIDFFIGLPYDDYKNKYKGLSKSQIKKVSKKEFLELCNNWILKALIGENFKNPTLLYAEHPYVTVNYKNSEVELKIDIVLYFDLPLEYIREKGPITAVDRSPWHGKFIKENLTDNQKNDVRLLKQFFKACHSYGDKSAIGKVGFIGYSAELLVYYLGDALSVFKKFSELKEIPLDYFNRSKRDLKKNPRFQNDALLIIDPIDKNRNVASAISKRAYDFCASRILEFLKKPNLDFFEIKPIPLVEINDKEDPILTKIFIIELKNEDAERHYTINRDKLYKLGESIKANGEKEYSHDERFGTIIFEIYFEDLIQEYNIAFYCENPNISEYYLRRGPPINQKSHVKKFIEKNPNYIEKDGFLWTKTKRKYTNFKIFLKDFIKEKLPPNFRIINLSEAREVKTNSGKRTITVLKDMVLPLYIKK
ncbi:MAG: hypothetical protein ACTSQP_03935 [Promethearchaeota archaeon]